MTNQEIEKVGIAMSVLLDDMNVEDQMVAVTSVMQAVVLRAALECPQMKKGLIKALGVAYQHIVYNVKHAKEEDFPCTEK
jgi:hypothetical protein